MLTKDFGLKLKVLEESGTFVGIAHMAIRQTTTAT